VKARRALAAALLALAPGCAARPGAAPEVPAGFALPALPPEPARPERLLLVSLAGLTPDRYGFAPGPGPEMPLLAALARAGVAAEAVEGVAPAATAPAHASLVTGRRPAGHGIAGDVPRGPPGVAPAPGGQASQLRAPALWDLAARAGRRVACLGWPGTVGAAVPSLLPDLVPSRPEESWLAALAGAASPELLPLLERAGGADPAARGPGPERDAALVGVACELLGRPEGPELLLLHLSQAAPALAGAGPASPLAREAFARVDALLVRLLVCAERGAPLARSALVVVGDHGFASVHTAVAPNAELARAGLLAPPTHSGGVVGGKARAHPLGGSAFLYAGDDRSALQARELLEVLAERTRAFRVVSAQEMLAAGADPQAWFGLEARPGFAFAEATAGPFLRPAAFRASGGYFPARSGMGAGFAAWGRGLRAGVRVPEMRQIDVAPTLATLLGLRLPEADGSALVGILDLPEAPPE